MQAFLKELAAIVGQDNVLTDSASRLAYARGAAFAPATGQEPLPLACVRPRQLAQVGKILSLCSRAGQPVSFRGGATAFAPTSALVIITTGLDRIYEVNSVDQAIHMQPGVVCQAAQEAAAREQLYLPGLPLSATVATIGGALANNAVGPDATRYGFLSGRVLSLDLWLSSGEKVTCFSANDLPGEFAPGLPLAGMAAGSRGCLGFIGDVYLRLIPAPATRTRLLASGSLENVAAAAMSLATLQPAELYLLNGLAAETISGESSAMLYVELHEPGQDERARAIVHGRQLAELATVPDFLKARAGVPAALYGKMGPFLREVCSFPASRLDKFICGVREIEARRQTPLAIYGNAAAARMEALIFPGHNQETASECARELFSLELMLNESLRSEADATLTRAEWLKQRHDRELERQLQKLFDPAGILAPPATSA